MCLAWQPPDGSAVKTHVGTMEAFGSIIMVYHLGDGEKIGVLLEALHDQEWRLRFWAVRSLAGISDRAAVEALINALNDRDNDIREKAAEGLGELRTHRVIEPLIAALKDSNEDVRERATESLMKITENYFGQNHGSWQNWWNENRATFLKGR